MARVNRPQKCRQCHGFSSEHEPLSWRGLHIECAIARMAANNTQLNEHAGPYFQHWRRRSLAALGVKLDDETISPHDGLSLTLTEGG